MVSVNIDAIVSILREEGQVDVFGARQWAPDSSDEEDKFRSWS
jgi:hypothetical protein